MGSVWIAHQSEPVKRSVAIKLIKAGMDSKAVLARFDAERQALALMDHPNIAKVFDGGLHDGRPFFVMELVKGESITEFCDGRKLSPRERLELFVPVCQAIQHAHQKGIIHRDIKPSNVLVALYDDRPVPKVIDFGVAKATGGALTEHTLETELGGVLGTPAYMSPEQATLNNLDIDTRSDVYALGVLLYELLTGSPPFSKRELEKRGLLEMLRIVREEDPPRPSTKLSTAAELPIVAAQRSTDPKQLTGLLRNERDWIVMKALEKDRTRRYESANSFAADVLRYLNGEAVQAHPPSAAYRLKKFARHHAAALSTAAAIVLLLVAGLAGTTWQAVRATIAEGQALESAAKERQATKAALASAAAEKAANDKAQKRLTLYKNNVANTTAIFADLDIRAFKHGAEPLEAILAKRLVQAGEQLDEETIADPLVTAGLQERLGWSLLNLGESEAAIRLLSKARKTRAAMLSADHIDTLITTNHLALGHRLAGDFNLALPQFEEALQGLRARYGNDHTETLMVLNNLALTYQDAGQLDLAVPLFEETLKLRKAKLEPDDPDLLESMSNLARGYQAAGKLDLALPLCEQALQLRKTKLGPHHADTLSSMHILAMCYRDQEKLELARPLFEETLQLLKIKIGTEHPETLLCMTNLALVYRDLQELDLALPLLEEALKLTRLKRGVDHPATLICMDNLALAYQDAGKTDLAVALNQEVLKLRKAKLGKDDDDTLRNMDKLADGYLLAGNHEEALPLLEEALKIRKSKLGSDHPETLSSATFLARYYLETGKLGLALPMLVQTLELQKSKLGTDHSNTLTTMNNLAAAYRLAGKPELAIQLWKETLDIQKSKLGDDDPNTLATKSNLAAGYWGTGKRDQAIPLWEETLRVQRTTLGDDSPDTRNTIGNLAVGYQDTGKLDLALPLLQKMAIGIEQQNFQHMHDGLFINRLIVCHEQLQQFGQAEIWRRKWLAVHKRQGDTSSIAYISQVSWLGVNLLRQKKWAEAEPVLQECLTLIEKVQPDSWSTFSTQSMLGGALLGQKKLTEAEPLLLKGYEGLKSREKKLPKVTETRLTEALDRLIELYTATDQPDEVKKWQAERDKYPADKHV